MWHHSKQNGVAAIEFAILLLPMIVILLGITEFGRAIYQYNTVTKAVRDATRYLTAQTPGDTNAAQAAACLVQHGDYQNCTAPPNYSSNANYLAPGLNSVNISVCYPTGCITYNNAPNNIPACPSASNQTQGINPSINMVTVMVCGYTFTPTFIPFFRSLTSANFSKSITFDNISTTMRSQ